VSEQIEFGSINEVKVNMDYIYDKPDPRAYFRELCKLDYSIPDSSKPIFLKLIDHLRKKQKNTVEVLDLGCSYGVNAAILKHDLSMEKLYNHWSADKMVKATSEELVAYDQQFYADESDLEKIKVVGLDQAENAIVFALKSGLLDDGIVINLETEPLLALAAKKLERIDLVMSTGCVGYVTEKSFECILGAVSASSMPWIANFVLRMFPFNAIEKELDNWGYVTEKLEGKTFFQRKFISDDEQDKVIQQLSELGVDPAGNESEGNFFAEFYLSRPRVDIAEMPLEALLSV
jgi:hypothetical protein